MFAIVSIALFMSSLDGTIVATGLPTLRRALHAGLNWTAWTITAYQLGIVVAMPMAGRVADNLGRKRVFVGAAMLFTTSSLLCGLATNIEMLIGLRVLQAAGGAAFMPAASGIVMDVFGHNRQRALGLFSSIFPLGALVGPIVGGIILTNWSWRAVFLVNVPIGSAFTMLAWKYLPSSGGRPGRPDVAGAVLMGGGVLGLMLAITDLGSRTVGVTSPSFLIPFALAVLCGWAFVRHCATAADPVIPLLLLKGRAFAASNAINVVWGGCAIGFGSLVPLFAEDRYGLSPLSSGTLLTARAIGEIVLAISASVLIHRTGYRVPIVAGIALIAGGMVMIAHSPGPGAVAVHVARRRSDSLRARHRAVGPGSQQRVYRARAKRRGGNHRAQGRSPQRRRDCRHCHSHLSRRSFRPRGDGAEERFLRARRVACLHGAPGVPYTRRG